MGQNLQNRIQKFKVLIVTAELSLYPLNGDYEPIIIKFIQTLKSHPNIEVFTHSMSTYVRGKSDEVFPAINSSMKSIGEDSDTVSLVIKLINRPLKPEAGLLNFD